MSREQPESQVDAEIAAALASGSDADWMGLWEAVDALAEEVTFATWAGGDVVGTTLSGGEERPVYQMPYAEYSESVDRVRSRLGALQLFVPFDWMNWDGLNRYRDDKAALADAPVVDAVRMLTAIQRSERFTEGSIEGALTSGLMQAALARLRHWHNEERTSRFPFDAG